MNPEKNPRADSKLKRLPQAVQAEMARHLASPSVRLKDVAAWLSQDGISVSISALSNWLSWYQARSRRSDREERILAHLQEERRLNRTLSEDAFFRLGQRMFSEIALAEEDAKGWYQTQKLTMDRDQRRNRR